MTGFSLRQGTEVHILYQSRPDLQDLPASLSPYLTHPARKPELSSPRAGLPFPGGSSLYNLDIFGLSLFSLLLFSLCTWASFSFSLLPLRPPFPMVTSLVLVLGASELAYQKVASQ